MKFIKPQLARPWEERRDLRLIDQNGISIEPKLDGHRVAVIKTRSGVLLLSRRAKPIQTIPWLETWAQRQLKPGTYVDGELVVPQSCGSSNNVSSYRAHHPELLSYVAFDILWHKGEEVHELRWHERRAILMRLSTMSHNWPGDGNLSPGRFYVIGSYPREFMQLGFRKRLVQDWIEQGFEGAIFKDMFIPYKPNSRSGWVKQKVTQTVEAIVVSCDALPSEWRVRPGQVGTDGVYYPDGLHTDPWEKGYVNLEYGYGPWPDEMTGIDDYKLVPGVGVCSVAGSLGVTGPKVDMQAYVGQVVEIKCWGAYPSGAVRHPSPQAYREWDGKFYSQPVPTVEVET